MKVVVYSAVSGGYDVVLPPKFRDDGVEYVLLTDRQPLLRGGWTVRPLPPETAGMSPSEANRWCKFFGHRIFPEADATVYVDGNVRQTASFLPWLREMEEAGVEIGLFAHPRRATVAEEHARCIEVGKIALEELERYEERLRAYAKDLPGEAPLTENSIILRRGASHRLEAAMEVWWREFRRGIRRDQISLPWVLTAEELQTDWESLKEADDELLINSLSMLLGFDYEDKQALLEAPSLSTRRETLVTLMEFALRGGANDEVMQ